MENTIHLNSVFCAILLQSQCSSRIINTCTYLSSMFFKCICHFFNDSKINGVLSVFDVDKDENSIGRSGIDTIKTACFVLMTAFSYKLLI